MGRRQFESVVAQAPKVSLKEIFSENTLALGATSEVIDVYASPGTKGRTVAVYMQASPPTGATSGSHIFRAYNVSNTAITKPIYFDCRQVYNQEIQINGNSFRFFDANNSYPTSVDAQVNQMQNMVFDDSKALRLYYQNATNVNQTNKRTIFCLVEEMETR